MKKLLLIFFCCLGLSANATFVNLDTRNLNIPLDEMYLHFEELFSIEGSSFELFHKDSDNLGFYELDYQQKINGYSVEGCALFVHGKNGKVTYINGDIITSCEINTHSKKYTSRKTISCTDSIESERMFIYVSTTEGRILHEVYRFIKGGEIIYQDVYSGEIVQRLPMFVNSTACSATTKYANTQTIYCNKSDNKYILEDDSRGIHVRRTKMDWSIYPYASGTTMYEYSNDNTNWNHNYLTSFTITSINSDSWWKNYVAVGGDNGPDIYITIYDANDNCIYVSDIKFKVEALTLETGKVIGYPLTFNISKLLPLENNSLYTIKVYDCDNGETLSGDDDLGFTLTINNNSLGTHTWGSSSKTMQGSFVISNSHPSFDVLWGLERTYDYYLNTFNHRSYDNKGSITNAYIHTANSTTFNAGSGNGQYYEYASLNGTYWNQYDQAFASTQSPYFMHFGLGSIANPQMGLNTTSHEFTHLVTTTRAKGTLLNKGESGSINEGFSDVFAICVENYVYGTTNWIYDEDSKLYGNKGCRNLADPANSGEGEKPTVYGDFAHGWVNPLDTTNDGGGVHDNNSIFSHWFYLLSVGKDGVNSVGTAYSVKGIGIDKAQRIAYRMLITYLPQNCDYPQARTLALNAAADLYGDKSQEYISVMNAWHAVGVGDAYNDFELTPGKYVIVTNRNVGKDDWFYMTSGLGTAGTKRLQAVSTGEKSIGDITITELPDSMVWELVKDSTNWKLKNGTKYLSWYSGNSATLDATGKSLSFTITRNVVNAHFNDGTDERYLSLNGTTGNDYLAFYKESVTTSIKDLYFLPYKEKEKSKEYVILARRSNKSNWFYMTSERDGTTEKPKDRFKAVDSGISTSTGVATTSLDDKYYWTIETTNEGAYLKSKKGYFVSWSSGNTALLEKSGLLLDYTESANAGFKWFFLTDTSGSEPQTRYLSLNKTDGNNYFAFYPAQVKDLLVIEKGGSIPTDLDQLTDLPSDRFTKIIKDGQLYILRDGKTYNAQGTEVR